MNELSEAASHLLRALESLEQEAEKPRDTKDSLYCWCETRTEPAAGCIRKGYDLLKQARTCLENIEPHDGARRIIDGSLEAISRALNDLEPLRIAAEWYDRWEQPTFKRFPYRGPEYEFLGKFDYQNPHDSRIEHLTHAVGHWKKKHDEELRFRASGLADAAEKISSTRMAVDRAKIGVTDLRNLNAVRPARDLENLDQLERDSVQTLFALRARNLRSGKSSGEVLCEMELQGIQCYEQETVRDCLASEKLAGIVEFDGKNRGRKYWLTDTGWMYGQKL